MYTMYFDKKKLSLRKEKIVIVFFSCLRIGNLINKSGKHEQNTAYKKIRYICIWRLFL